MTDGAAIEAKALGLRTRRERVFHDVDLDVAPGGLVAIAGPNGSGRTSLLLALAGRFPVNQGTLRVAGQDLPRHSRRVQRLASLGYVPGVHEPEPSLTAAEHVTERLLLTGDAPLWPRQRKALARRLLADSAYHGDPDVLGRDLGAYQRQLLCLALATLEQPKLVAVDALDTDVSVDELTSLWDELRKLADTGVTVIAVCREFPDGDVPGGVDQVVTLPAVPADEPETASVLDPNAEAEPLTTTDSPVVPEEGEPS